MKTSEKQFDLSYLSDKEKSLMEAVERGEFKSVDNLEERKKELQGMARKALKKKMISIRLPEQDIERIRSMAQRDGIPYQTLITSILHRYADGTLKRTD